jgi:hypothetical protein
MKFIILVFVSVNLTFLIKKYFFRIRLAETFLNYKRSIFQLRDFSRDLEEYRNVLNSLCIYGITLLFKTFIFFVPYLIIFSLIIIFEFPIFLIFIIPFLPYLILFKNE